MDSITSERKDFLAEEIRSLRESVKSTLHEARFLERYALALTGGIWTWMLTHDHGNLPKIGWWIPFFLTIIILSREAVLYIEIRRLAAYIRVKEEMFLGEEGGWETEVWRISRRVGTFRTPLAALFFWLLMVGGTALGPLLLAF